MKSKTAVYQVDCPVSHGSEMVELRLSNLPQLQLHLAQVVCCSVDAAPQQCSHCLSSGSNTIPPPAQH
ncbi:hypothetical protein JST97_36010 [bacterium]|nr:hypothetical protein [bacterium]